MSWPLLAGLSRTEAAELLDRTSVRTLQRGGALFRQGDEADALFLVEAGHVSLVVGTPGGDEAIVRVLGPGDHVGELALLTAAPRRTSALALDAVRVRVLCKRDLALLHERHPAVERHLLAALVTETDRLAGALTDSYFLPVADRVVRRLLELAAVYGPEQDRVVVPLTQDELARMVGTARPTINKVLRQMQDRGLVQAARGRVALLDVPALQRAGDGRAGAWAA